MTGNQRDASSYKALGDAGDIYLKYQDESTTVHVGRAWRLSILDTGVHEVRASIDILSRVTFQEGPERVSEAGDGAADNIRQYRQLIPA